MIKKFHGKNRFLSNFYPCRMTYEGLTYKSAEVAYQSAKCLNPKDRELFVNLDSGEAKKYGRKVAVRSNWDTIKVQVMKDILWIKFLHPELKERLLATGNETLVEGNTWKDVFWGYDVNLKRGENMLGKLLMQLRDHIRAEESESFV